jgi:hypothetical protein
MVRGHFYCTRKREETGNKYVGATMVWVADHRGPVLPGQDAGGTCPGCPGVPATCGLLGVVLSARP